MSSRISQLYDYVDSSKLYLITMGYVFLVTQVGWGEFGRGVYQSGGLMGTKSLNLNFMTGKIFSTFTASWRTFACIYLLSLCSITSN